MTITLFDVSLTFDGVSEATVTVSHPDGDTHVIKLPLADERVLALMESVSTVLAAREEA